MVYYPKSQLAALIRNVWVDSKLVVMHTKNRKMLPKENLNFLIIIVPALQYASFSLIDYKLIGLKDLKKTLSHSMYPLKVNT